MNDAVLLAKLQEEKKPSRREKRLGPTVSNEKESVNIFNERKVY